MHKLVILCEMVSVDYGYNDYYIGTWFRTVRENYSVKFASGWQAFPLWIGAFYFVFLKTA